MFANGVEELRQHVVARRAVRMMKENDSGRVRRKAGELIRDGFVRRGLQRITRGAARMDLASVRSSQLEIMDTAPLSPTDMARTLDFLAMTNKWFGGARVVTKYLDEVGCLRKQYFHS